MRAAVLYGKEDVRVEQITPTPLQAGEVRIQIEAALTCGTDLKVFKRGYHAKMIVPPAVFGHELAGIICETSHTARGEVQWHVGERVVVANSAPCGVCFYCGKEQENLCDDLLFLNGAYAESIVVPARIAQKNLLRLGQSTEFRDAALVEPLACVVQGIEETGLRPGQNVLVLGQTKQFHTQQWSRCEIERSPARFSHMNPDARFAEFTQILRNDIDLSVRIDHSDRFTVFTREDCSHCFMPGNDRVNAGLQRLYVERPFQPQDARDVVRAGLRTDLIDGPKTFLREGERNGHPGFAVARKMYEGRFGLRTVLASQIGNHLRQLTDSGVFE